MTTSLTRVSEGDTALAAFLPGIWTRIGWIAPDGMTRDEYLFAGDTLIEWEYGRPWCLGDFIIYGESAFGEMYAQAMEITGLSYERLAHYVSVCRRFDFCRRRQLLTFTHHETVSAKRFSADEQDYWLDEAEREGWSASELGRQVAAWEREARNDRLAADGMITDVEPEPPSEPQFNWLDPETGEIGDGAPRQIATGAWVRCPECGHHWQLTGGSNGTEGRVRG